MTNGPAPITKNCPYCDRPMESGYVLDQTLLGTTLATIGWLPGTREPSPRGFQDEMDASPLFPLDPVSSQIFLRVPRFPGF
jgi:hypothetical protein